MNITMTWADGALALILGVIGSILAAYLYNRLPNFSAIASRWLAQRSRQATEVRLVKLQKQIKQIETLKGDERRYIGWMIYNLAHFQMRLSFSLLLFLIATGTLITSAIDKTPASDLLYALGSLAFGFGFGILFLASNRHNDIREFANIERKERELREEISELQSRLA